MWIPISLVTRVPPPRPPPDVIIGDVIGGSGQEGPFYLSDDRDDDDDDDVQIMKWLSYIPLQVNYTKFVGTTTGSNHRHNSISSSVANANIQTPKTFQYAVF